MLTLNKKTTSSAQILHHSHYTQIHVHKHAPLHPHETVAIAQININAWPLMSLAVTGPL